jgi:MFS family permease
MDKEQLTEQFQREKVNAQGVIEFKTTEEAIQTSEESSLKYQTCTLIALFICGLAIASFGSLLSYQTIQPNMLCKLNAEFGFVQCTMEQACSNNYESKVDTATSIINWMVDYNLLCKKSYLANVMIYIFFGGCLLSAVIISPLSDRIGRKTVLIIIMVAYVLITFKAITSDDYISLIFVLIASGFFVGSYYNVAIMLMIESTSINYRAYYATLLFSSAPVGGFIVAPFFNKFKDWKTVSAIIAISALIFTISLLFIKDSPRYYAAIKDYKAATKSASHLIYWNKLQNIKVAFAGSDAISKTAEAEHSKAKVLDTYSFNELFHYNTVTSYTYVMIICSFIFNNMYLGMVLNSEQLILSNYYNAMATAALDFFACILAGILLQKYGRPAVVSKFHYLSCALAIVLAFLYMLPKQYHAISLIVNRFLSLIVLNGGYLYAIEIFPTRIRGKGIGMCSVFGNLGKVLAYLVTNMGHKYTYLFGIIGLVGFLSVSWWIPDIPDMGKTVLSDEVAEIENKIYSKIKESVQKDEEMKKEEEKQT